MVVAVLAMFVWFGVALVFRRRFQFSLRSLLVLTVAVALPCSWFAMKMKRTERQEKAISMVLRMQGSVLVDSDETSSASLSCLGPTYVSKRLASRAAWPALVASTVWQI